MIQRPPLSIFFHTEPNERSLTSLLSYLDSMDHVRLHATPHLPDELTPYDVIVTFNRQYPEPTLANLTGFIRNGGGWLMLVDLADNKLPDILAYSRNRPGRPLNCGFYSRMPNTPWQRVYRTRFTLMATIRV